MRVAIIGGGPAGLVTLKYLATAHQYFPLSQPIEVVLFESAEKIGGVFFHHSYEEGEMVSSRFLTCFSDFRPPNTDPDYYTSEQYTSYLRKYVSHFRLWPNIKTSTKVLSVRRRDGGGHIVMYQTDGQLPVEWEVDAVAVCTGLHDQPVIPQIPGIEHVPETMHSNAFKGRYQLANKTVMLLGCGETAADIGYLGMTTSAAHAAAKQVVMCHRDGFLGAPKAMPRTVLFPALRGFSQSDFDKMDHYSDDPVPIDVSQSTLFDTMYVHPMVRDSMFIWNHYKMIAIDGSWIVSGSNKGVDQYVGHVSEHRRHPSRLLFMKAWNRIQAFVTPPYRPDPKNLSWAETIRRHIVGSPRPDPGRYIDLAPFPTHFDSSGQAHFVDNGRAEYPRIASQVIRPDLIIFCTGYQQTFPFFQAHNAATAEATSPAGRKPYPEAKDANVRNIFMRSDPSIAFIGFLRPGLGAIPPLAEMQAMFWTMALLGHISTSEDHLSPEDEWHYRILSPAGARLKYGIEHEAYVWQLGCDMGIAPGITDVLRLGWRHSGPRARAGCTPGAWYKLPLVWLGGNHYPPKFRLVGKYAAGESEKAVGYMTNELWGPMIRRKGLFGNFTLVAMPVTVLGLVSLWATVYCFVWAMLAKLRLAGPVKWRNQLKEIWMEEERKERMIMTNGIDSKGAVTVTEGKVFSNDPKDRHKFVDGFNGRQLKSSLGK